MYVAFLFCLCICFSILPIYGIITYGEMGRDTVSWLGCNQPQMTFWVLYSSNLNVSFITCSYRGVSQDIDSDDEPEMIVKERLVDEQEDSD